MGQKFLITGVSGQLGSNFAYLLSQKCNKPCELIGTFNSHGVYSELFNNVRVDLSSIDNVKQTIGEFKPDVVIHCAALTNMDLCEKDKDLAYKSNVLATKNLCEVFNESKFVYISTDNTYGGGDYVYSESDNPSPNNIYGLTKLIGETQVRQLCKNHLIVRTNIYGWDNRNNSNSFLERIYRSLISNNKINLFYDVTYCPISVNLLFEVIFECIKNDICGTYNVVGPSLTKYHFGTLISEIFNLDKNLINPISMDDLTFDAKRCKVLNLSNDKIAKIFPKIKMSTHEQLIQMKFLLENSYKEQCGQFLKV